MKECFDFSEKREEITNNSETNLSYKPGSGEAFLGLVALSHSGFTCQ